MSFADYTSVKAELLDWMHRADLSSQADSFIDLFESDFNANNRVRQMEAQTSQVATAGYLLHPTSWLGWKKLTCTVGSQTYALEPVTDEIALKRTIAETGGSTPRYYKVTGSKTYLYPAPSSATIGAVYYEGVALSSGTNWLLTAYPGAYLYGSLLQATAYVGDDPRVPLWGSAYSQIISLIKSDSKKQEWSGQALQMNNVARSV